MKLETIQRPPKQGNWLKKLLKSSGIEKFLKKISEEECEELEAKWLYNARNAQYPPEGDWNVWLICAGRGFGKTRAGAEWIKMNAEAGVKRQALVGATASDVRKVMIEGESGILSVCPGAEYKSQVGRILFPNGAIAECFSAEKPNRLRGPQFEAAWCDELAAWTYDQETWDMLSFGVRLGSHPRILVTTTPKPRPLIRELFEDSKTIITTGSTYENQDNLSAQFIKRINDKYKGTRLGRQELMAELLEDVEGALWSRKLIQYGTYSDYSRIVVGVDPAVTSTEESDETGIIVAARGRDHQGYVLADYSCKDSPNEWAKVVVNAYHKFKADRVVAEVNNGGDLVESVLRTVDKNLPITKVRASRGKLTRAEPIAALYEQEKVKHLKPFDKLEDQMCTWVPETLKKSPDRMDALVWALSDLMLRPERNYEILCLNG